jgi:antitoxin (DNA-binding transcriptional repressor) of toxin-antitoxin stability system
LARESYLFHMSIKTVTVRELRTSFPKVEAMLLGGEQIVITKRGRIIALLVEPSKSKRSRKLDWKRRFGAAVAGDEPRTDVVGLLLREREESL